MGRIARLFGEAVHILFAALCPNAMMEFDRARAAEKAHAEQVRLAKANEEWARSLSRTL